ncbi:MAG: hypothetical protein ACI9BC_001887 [Crocinitomicaceae bacterium]|jgi:hypothetical protein
MLDEGKTRDNVLAAEQAWSAQDKALTVPINPRQFNPVWENGPVVIVYGAAHNDRNPLQPITPHGLLTLGLHRCMTVLLRP